MEPTDGTLLDSYPGAEARQEEDRDWVEAAREMLQPMEVGERFFLVPEWRDDPAPAGRFRMVVNPGMAFGTGVHETTRLCLEALERYVRPGMDVLDVGTGSGILARAAGLLGARRVYACDIGCGRGGDRGRAIPCPGEVCGIGGCGGEWSGGRGGGEYQPGSDYGIGAGPAAGAARWQAYCWRADSRSGKWNW